MAMGNEWRNLDRYWDWPTYGFDDYFWFRFFEWWGVVCHEVGSTGTGWAEFKDMQWQVLHKNETNWVRYQTPKNATGWGQDYIPNGNGYIDWVNGQPVPDITTQAGEQGGVSIRVLQNTAPHFTAAQSRYETPRMGEIEGVIACAMVRRDSRSDPGAKLLCHIGGDPKPSGHPSTDGVQGAYTPFALSKTCRLTSTWRRITASNFQRPTEFNRRHLSLTRARATRPIA
jgi:hypothetical protein